MDICIGVVIVGIVLYHQ